MYIEQQKFEANMQQLLFFLSILLWLLLLVWCCFCCISTHCSIFTRNDCLCISSHGANNNSSFGICLFCSLLFSHSDNNLPFTLSLSIFHSSFFYSRTILHTSLFSVSLLAPFSLIILHCSMFIRIAISGIFSAYILPATPPKLEKRGYFCPIGFNLLKTCFVGCTKSLFIREINSEHTIFLNAPKYFLEIIKLEAVFFLPLCAS